MRNQRIPGRQHRPATGRVGEQGPVAHRGPPRQEQGDSSAQEAAARDGATARGPASHRQRSGAGVDPRNFLKRLTPPQLDMSLTAPTGYATDASNTRQ